MSKPLVKDDGEVLQRIADALSGASFGLRALSGQADVMGSVELLASAVRDGLADVASSIRELAEAVENSGHRAVKPSKNSGRVEGVSLESILKEVGNGSR